MQTFWCKFLGNLPRGGSGVSGAFVVVLGCEGGGTAVDEKRCMKFVIHS